MKSSNILTFLVATAGSCASAQTAQPPVLASPRFEQVALTTVHISAARSFYRDRLGLKLLFEANNMLFFDVSGTRLMIAQDDERMMPAKPTGILYFHVDDFEGALNRLRGTSVKLVGAVEAVQSSPAGTLRLQQFEDPDGNMLAIMGFEPS